jgi:hypothetical protein
MIRRSMMGLWLVALPVAFVCGATEDGVSPALSQASPKVAPLRPGQTLANVPCQKVPKNAVYGHRAATCVATLTLSLQMIRTD